MCSRSKMYIVILVLVFCVIGCSQQTKDEDTSKVNPSTTTEEENKTVRLEGWEKHTLASTDSQYYLSLRCAKTSNAYYFIANYDIERFDLKTEEGSPWILATSEYGNANEILSYNGSLYVLYVMLIDKGERQLTLVQYTEAGEVREEPIDISMSDSYSARVYMHRGYLYIVTNGIIYRQSLETMERENIYEASEKKHIGRLYLIEDAIYFCEYGEQSRILQLDSAGQVTELVTTKQDRSIAFSISSSKQIFYYDLQQGICVYDISTGKQRVVTATPSVNNCDTLSFDGKYTYLDNSRICESEDLVGKIEVYNTEGDNLLTYSTSFASKTTNSVYLDLQEIYVSEEGKIFAQVGGRVFWTDQSEQEPMWSILVEEADSYLLE